MGRSVEKKLPYHLCTGAFAAVTHLASDVHISITLGLFASLKIFPLESLWDIP